MAIRVKKRYDARQNVAGAWGLRLEAWGLRLFFIIPDPWSIATCTTSLCLAIEHNGSGIKVEHLVSRPFLTSWFHQWPVTKKPVRLRLYFCLLNLIRDQAILDRVSRLTYCYEITLVPCWSLFKASELIHQIQILIQNCFAFGLEIHAILSRPLRSQFLAFVLQLQLRILYVLFFCLT